MSHKSVFLAQFSSFFFPWTNVSCRLLQALVNFQSSERVVSNNFCQFALSLILWRREYSECLFPHFHWHHTPALILNFITHFIGIKFYVDNSFFLTFEILSHCLMFSIVAVGKLSVWWTFIHLCQYVISFLLHFRSSFCPRYFTVNSNIYFFRFILLKICFTFWILWFMLF